MPQITTDNSKPGVLQFTVTLTPEDYQQAFEKELKEYRKQGSFKGFRKGKTPMSFLKKQFGTRVLSQVVNEKLAEAVEKFTEENPRTYAGALPTREAKQPNYNAKELGDYVFNLQIGQYPDIELEGISESDIYEKLEVKFSDEEVNDFLEKTLLNAGEQKEDTEKIEEKDLVKLEYSDGKEDGLAGEFSLALDRATEAAKAAILERKPGDTFSFNVFELEQDTDRDFVIKNMIGVEPDELGEDFDGTLNLTILHGSRRVPAEMDEEFFNHFPDEVTDEASLRAHLVEINQGAFRPNASALLMREFQDRLMEKNGDKLELDEDFIKATLLYGQASAEYKKGVIQNDARFQKHLESVRWELIQMMLNEKFGIEITDEDIRAGFRNQIMGYFGGQSFADESFIENMVDRMMQNDDGAVNKMIVEIGTEKLGEALEAAVDVQAKVVSTEDFEAQVKAINERFQREQDELAAGDPVIAEEE